MTGQSIFLTECDGLTYLIKRSDEIIRYVIDPTSVDRVKKWLKDNESNPSFIENPSNFLEHEMKDSVHTLTSTKDSSQITDTEFVQLLIKTFTKQNLEKFGIIINHDTITLPKTLRYTEQVYGNGRYRIGKIHFDLPSINRFGYITLSKKQNADAILYNHAYPQLLANDIMEIFSYHHVYQDMSWKYKYDGKRIIGYATHPDIVNEWIRTNRIKLLFVDDPFGVMEAESSISGYISRFHPSIIGCLQAMVLI